MDLSTVSEGEECNQAPSAALDNAPDRGQDQLPADETQTDGYASRDIDDTSDSKCKSRRADSEPASMRIVAGEQGQEHDTARPTTPDSSLPRKRVTPPSPEPTPRTSRRFDIEQKRGYHRKSRPKSAVTYLNDSDIIAPFAPVRNAVKEGGLAHEERAFNLTRPRHGKEAGPSRARGEKSLLNPSSQRRFSKSPRRSHLSKEASTAKANENQENAPTSNFSSSSSEGEIESDNENNKQLANDETQGATKESRSASIDVHDQFSSESIITQSSTSVDVVSSTATIEPAEPPPTSIVSNSEGNLEDGTPQDELIDAREADQPSTNDTSLCVDIPGTLPSNEPLSAQQLSSIDNSDHKDTKTAAAGRKDPEQELAELEKQTGLSRVEGLAIQKRFYSLEVPDEDSREYPNLQRTRLNFEKDARAHEEERCGVKSPHKSPPLPEDPDVHARFMKSVAFRLVEERNKALKDLDWEKGLVKSLKDKIKEQQDELDDQIVRSGQAKNEIELEVHDLSERTKKLQQKLITSEQLQLELKQERTKLRHDCVRMKEEFKENLVRLTKNDKQRQAKFEGKVEKLNKFTDELQDRNDRLESENEDLRNRNEALWTHRMDQVRENLTEHQEGPDEFEKRLDAVIKRVKRGEDFLRESGYQEDEDECGQLQYADDLQDRKKELESENESLQKRIEVLEMELENHSFELHETRNKHREVLAVFQKHVETSERQTKGYFDENGDLILPQEVQDELQHLRHTKLELEQTLQKKEESFEDKLRFEKKKCERLASECREWEARVQREIIKCQKMLQGKDERMELLQRRLKTALSAIAASGSASGTGPFPPSVANDSIATSTTSAPQVQPSEQPKFSLLAESKQWQARISNWRKGGEWKEMREALRRQRQEENEQEAAART